VSLRVLHVAPHPDDEALGAPCTLLRLKDAGARVVVVACGRGGCSGRPWRDRHGGQALPVAGTAGGKADRGRAARG